MASVRPRLIRAAVAGLLVCASAASASAAVRIKEPATVSPNTVALIVMFEVGNETRYRARYQGVVCPGGASGPTVGIGFDGGHQTPETIIRAFRGHPAAKRMATVMPGAIGPDRCAAARTKLTDVRVPWATALRIFEADTLPDYAARTRRAFGRPLDNVPPDASGSVVATVYNRGHAMLGSARREMRTIRDECLPAASTACMATQYRSMTRLWRGTPIERGLAARYEATARLAEGKWQP